MRMPWAIADNPPKGNLPLTYSATPTCGLPPKGESGNILLIRDYYFSTFDLY